MVVVKNKDGLKFKNDSKLTEKTWMKSYNTQNLDSVKSENGCHTCTIIASKTRKTLVLLVKP